MREAPLKVVIAGGGTGGHLFPAMAIAEALRRKSPGCLLHFVGSRYGIERDRWASDRVAHTLLSVRGIARSLSLRAILRNTLFPLRFAGSYLRSLFLLLRFRPSVVVGTGGYASGLPLLVASHLSIPTLIHEQNSFPGWTTRRLAARADVVCLGYLEAAGLLKKKSPYTRATRSGRSC